ncbi:MAG TPA: group I intron-associated PD-(D/E)XK endonuclease [Pyrinomonadaceae bacterium]|nr:group I intron-associated PD-(D/E)XK endonuclease [Pyrinomonadaceae bacterium]
MASKFKYMMNLVNPNKKGTLGEIAVCKELLKLGYSVFFEFGNASKVDLIVLDDNYITYKIQVKTVDSKNEVITVYSIKNCLNPKYNSTYTTDQVDIFAVYVRNKDLVFYVSAKEVLQNSKASKFRLSETKNGQKQNVRYVNDYLDFERALRDYTPHTPTDNAVGDEIVQTTTLAKAASES